MKDLAKYYFDKGYNCCEAVIMAANQKYALGISKDALKLASCINNGMGMGHLCGAIIGGIMVIGYVFEKEVAPEHSNLNHIRMSFLNDVNITLKSLNCFQILKLPIVRKDCSQVVSIIADFLDKTIMEFI